MKLLPALLALPVALLAQPDYTPAPVSLDPGYHRHDGFFLSMNLGAALGGTRLEASGSDAQFSEGIYRGGGTLLDFKIGGALRENLILSADLIGRVMTGPEVEIDGEVLGDASDDLALTDNTFGMGVTYYFMPHNVFVSGTVGIAQFTVENEAADTKGESKTGLGVHLKVGKEWWVGKNWGLGVSGGYGFLKAADKAPAGADYKGELTSQQFYVLFNTTFN